MLEQKEGLRVVHYMRQTAALSVKDKVYKRMWLNNANKVEAFEDYLGLKLYTNSFSKLITDAYVHFLRSSPKKYKNSTVKQFIVKLKEALDDAKEDGHPINAGYKIRIANEEAFSIALNEKEIEAIFYLGGLRRQAHAIRERFVIGCCLGLRYSDLESIHEDDFKTDYYQRSVKKGKQKVVIPVHWMIWEIIKRNNGVIPPIPSQQSFGATIKRVCKKAGITEKVLYEQTEGLMFVRKRLPKYKFVSPHTCRRSLATNMYLAGIPVKRIMLITGHKTEASFFRYIKILPQENADELSSHPYFTGKANSETGGQEIHLCPHCDKEIPVLQYKQAV